MNADMYPDGMLSNQAIMETLEAAVQACVNQLSDRQARVISVRHGLVGEKLTLEQTGAELGVTRERARQIEKQGMKNLRYRFRAQIQAAASHDVAGIWLTVTGAAPSVRRSELKNHLKSLPGYLRLAFDICGTRVPSWLDNHAYVHANGWLPPDTDEEQVLAIEESLRSEFATMRLPVWMPDLSQFGRASELSPILHLMGYVLASGFVLATRPTPRVNRAIRLCGILREKGILHLEELLSIYRARYSDDQCNQRDCEIAMNALPHLAQLVVDAVWSTTTNASARARRTPGPTTIEPPFALDYIGASSSQDSIAVRIAELLQREGPLTVGELLGRSSDILTNGQARTSIGPILTISKHLFRRLLPGLYDLRTPASDADPNRIRRIAGVFSEAQIAIYTYARRSGEQYYEYPLWHPITEAIWAQWAHRHAQTDVFRSLLTVIEPAQWPASTLQNEYRLLAQRHGAFAIAVPTPPLGPELPGIDRLLAAATFALHKGSLGWGSANRILRRRVLDSAGATLLALLVALDVLDEGQDHWQSRHEVRPNAQAFATEITRAFRRSGDLAWESEDGERIKERALAWRPTRPSWVSLAEIRTLFGGTALCDAEPQYANANGALEAVLGQHVASERRSSAERLLRMLGSAGLAEETP